MSFAVSADAYDRFMGRYSIPLAARFVEYAGLGTGISVLDVGCGPGALTGELVSRFGADSIAAVDPSPSFVAAMRLRYADVTVRQAVAEDLPFGDGSFDAALAQLVVHFMDDPVQGLSEMKRVTRPDGVVACCVWNRGGGQDPSAAFWRAARDLDTEIEVELNRPGTNEGQLGELMGRAGLRDITESKLSVAVVHPTFEEWWDPYTLGVGPAGTYLAGLEPGQRSDLRDRCQATLPEAPFTISAEAWVARGAV